MCFPPALAISGLTQNPPWGGGGGNSLKQSFIRGGSAPRSKPLPFYIPFLIEKVPLSNTVHRKLYPFHLPTERLLLNCSLQKPLKILGWISHWVRLFGIFGMSLLIPKRYSSHPFSILQLVKSLSFYKPPKGGHFFEGIVIFGAVQQALLLGRPLLLEFCGISCTYAFTVYQLNH